jgi:hypothetical protein
MNRRAASYRANDDDGPLPDADAEYRRARETQAALERHEKKCPLGIQPA